MKRLMRHPVLTANVIVSALGYFVDIYDLLLFSIVRVQSLRDLGVAETDLLPVGVHLINMQMFGMLIGGILWGVWGDRRGRVSVLFGSIVLYSLANLANAYVHSVEHYAWLRFIAGIGLAGELGAAITLVSETLSKEHRGYGTAIVAGVGVLGAILAALVADAFPWRTAYLIGGGLGLVLLVARISMFESGLFERAKTSNQGIARGNFLRLFTDLDRFRKYLACILIGVPIWFAIGILITFSPEIARELGTTGPVSAGKAVLWAYVGLSIGDIASGFLSQRIGSRKRVLFLFLTMTAAFVSLNGVFRGMSPEAYYALLALMGFGTGYWAVFITVASEQFGTNLRATVTTTVPNFVRGSVVLLTGSFQALRPSFGLLPAAMIVGFSTLLIALLATASLNESYGNDLDFSETA